LVLIESACHSRQTYSI